MIFAHYRQLVWPKEAAQYWNIRPATTEKIVPMLGKSNAEIEEFLRTAKVISCAEQAGGRVMIELGSRLGCGARIVNPLPHEAALFCCRQVAGSAKSSKP
ncbi:MAG: hypothetical protein H0X34_01085 [Chthoniobacterales bacterium]|nr:hypothetical protein [Chthoniobacterales bacterium]